MSPIVRLHAFAASFFALLCLFFGTSGQAAERTVDLFRPAAAQDRAVPAQAQGAARQRVLRLDLNALETAVVPRGLDKAQNRVQRAAKLRARVRVEVFPQVTGTFRRERVAKAHGGGYIWTGDEEFGRGEATLVIRGDKVTGHLAIDNRIYRIEPVSGTLHSISEILVDQLPPDAPHQKPRVAGDDEASAPMIAEEPPLAESAVPDTIVDLLVPYTLAASAGDVLADINLAVSLTNRAYRNSRVKVQLNLRGAMLVPGYDETAYSYTGTLYNLTNLEGADSDAIGRRAFDSVRLRRDQVGADLVALFRRGGAYCGQAWVIERPAPAYSGYGFSQITRGCVAGYTLAHELGHNMGLNHDRYVEPRRPNWKYNYGFVRVNKKDRDIMSYPDKCRDADVICSLRNRFSNPRQFIAGARFGRFQRTWGAADGTRRLNETRTAVSEYRDSGLLPSASLSTAAAP